MNDPYRVIFDPDKAGGICGWPFETLEEAKAEFERIKDVYRYIALQKIVTLEEYHRPNADPQAVIKERVLEKRKQRMASRTE